MDRKKLHQLLLGMIHQSVGIVDSLRCDLGLGEICGCYLNQGKKELVTYSIKIFKKYHQLNH